MNPTGRNGSGTHRESTRWGRSLDTGHHGAPWNQQVGNRSPSAPRSGMAPVPAGAEVPRNVCRTAWLVKGRPSPVWHFASRPLQASVKWEKSPRKGSPSPPGGRWTVCPPTHYSARDRRCTARGVGRAAPGTLVSAACPLFTFGNTPVSAGALSKAASRRRNVSTRLFLPTNTMGSSRSRLGRGVGIDRAFVRRQLAARDAGVPSPPPDRRPP
jgi:hypothetical protein